MSQRTAGPQRDPQTGTWWFVVDVGTTPTGRRRQARRRGFPTRKAAQHELDRLRVKTHTGAYVPPARQTFADFLNEWLAAVRPSLAPSTLESYERNIRVHVAPRLGGVQLQAVDPGHLNGLYAELLADGRRGGRSGGLAPRTVRYIATILHSALKDAVEWNRLVADPSTRAKPPSVSASRPPEMKTWDGETLARFLGLEEGGRYHPAWLTLATTGLRRGELLGLRWADLDLTNARASIRQTVTAIRHEIVTSSRTKTGRGRSIELDARTVATLRTWRKVQAKERLALGAGYEDIGLVFCFPDGRPYHPDRFSREFDRRAARHGLPRIRLHDLRHTWATLALEAGIDVKVVADRLGHSSPVITWQTYQHVTPALQAGAAEKVAALIFGR